MLVGQLPNTMLAGQVAAIDDRKPEGAQIGNSSIIGPGNRSYWIIGGVKNPKGHVGLARDRTSDVEPKTAGRHGNCGSERIHPKMRALCQKIGYVIGAGSPVRKAGEVNTTRIECIGILRLKNMEQILNRRHGRIT